MERKLCCLFLQVLLFGSMLFLIPETQAAANPLETVYDALKNQTGNDIRLGMASEDVISRYGLPIEETTESGYMIYTYGNDQDIANVSIYYFKNNRLEGFVACTNGSYLEELGNIIGFTYDFKSRDEFLGGSWLPSSPALKAIMYNKDSSNPKVIIIDTKSHKQNENSTAYFIAEDSMYRSGVCSFTKLFDAE